MNITIIGAGLIGRVLSLMISQRFDKYNLTLIDKNTSLESKSSCGYVAGGMISPYSELALNEKKLLSDGMKSLEYWPQIISVLPEKDKVYKKNGTLILSHSQDYHEAERLFNIINTQVKDTLYNIPSIYNKEKLKIYEPSLYIHNFSRNFMRIEQEASIDTQEFFSQSAYFLERNKNIIYQSQYIKSIDELKTNADIVIDARGLGAKNDNEKLFGIRGESMLVHAPRVHLQHSIRVVHPRHPLYIIPRSNNHYYIGATTIETDDESPISLRSTLELTSALYSIHEGFSESRIIDTYTKSRPTYSSGYPRIYYKNKSIHINGFYRHGYLLAPVFCERLITNYITKDF